MLKHISHLDRIRICQDATGNYIAIGSNVGAGPRPGTRLFLREEVAAKNAQLHFLTPGKVRGSVEGLEQRLIARVEPNAMRGGRHGLLSPIGDKDLERDSIRPQPFRQAHKVAELMKVLTGHHSPKVDAGIACPAAGAAEPGDVGNNLLEFSANSDLLKYLRGRTIDADRYHGVL